MISKVGDSVGMKTGKERRGECVWVLPWITAARGVNCVLADVGTHARNREWVA